MKELVGKKMGELLAFAEAGKDTLTRGIAVLTADLGEVPMKDIGEKLRIHENELRLLAEELSLMEVAEKQRAITLKDIIDMRDVYLENDWTNSAQLFEWLGFFEGAHIVHWSFVRGAASAAGHEKLLLLSEEAVNYHYELLEKFGTELESIGQEEGAS